MHDFYDDTMAKQIEPLVYAIEMRDAYTQGHSRRVAQYALYLGKWMGFDEVFVKKIYIVGMLHDLGKIGVPDNILLKPSSLVQTEFELIKLHSILSEKIIKKIELFDDLLSAVRHHHENFDGSGYPDGLKGAEIPLMSRIISVVDVFDALTTKRIYRDSMSMERALCIMNEEAQKGKFDPSVFVVFEKRILEIGVFDEDHLMRFSYPELEKQRNFFYYKNPITNLLNKSALLAFLRKGANNGESAFLAEINIRNFGEFNRIYGLARGDELLRQVGEFLSENLFASSEFDEPKRRDSYLFHGYADKFYLFELGIRGDFLIRRIERMIGRATEKLSTKLYLHILLDGEKIPLNIEQKVGYLL